MQQRTSSNAIAWLIITGLLLLLLTIGYFLFVPMHTGHPGPSDRSICRNNLRQITLALHGYIAEHGHLPPAYTVDEDGNPLHSWRTLLLPYLEQKSLYKSIDLTKPWDDPVNAAAFNTMPECYHCPFMKGAPRQHTPYLAISGEGFTIHDDAGRKALPPVDRQDLVFVVVPRNHAVHWMAPDDISPAELLRLCKQQKSTHEGTIPVSMYDGAYYSLSPEELKEMLSNQPGQ